MPESDARSIHGLYVIIDPSACAGRCPSDVARMAIAGGASVIQWRDKLRDKGAQLDSLKRVAAVCREHNVPLIVNDHADLALAVRADGVHLGQHDLPVESVRPLLGRPGIIGVSTNNVDEAVRAQEASADYVAVGAIFATGTKNDTRPADLDRIRQIKAAVRVPVVAIGGIGASNIADVVAAGADAAAVVSAVCGAADVRGAARELASAFTDDQPTPAPPLISPRRRQAIHRIITEFVATLQHRDRDAFMALFAPDGIIQDTTPTSSGSGPDAIGAWWDRLMAQQPSFDIAVERIHIPNNEAAVAWSIQHAHEGAARTAHGAVIMSFEANHIASVHAYWERDPGDSPSALAARRAAQGLVDAMNARDRDRYVDLWAKDSMRQDPVGGSPQIGTNSIVAIFDRVMASYPEYRVRADHICTSGDEAALTWTVEILRPDGNIVVQGIDIVSVDDAGKIIGQYSYRDVDSTPAPA